MMSRPVIEAPTTTRSRTTLKHAVWFLMGVQEKDDIEERTINALSNGEFAVMRHNAKLYRWIVRTAQK